MGSKFRLTNSDARDLFDRAELAVIRSHEMGERLATTTKATHVRRLQSFVARQQLRQALTMARDIKWRGNDGAKDVSKKDDGARGGEAARRVGVQSEKGLADPSVVEGRLFV